MLKISDPLPGPGSKHTMSIRADVDGLTFLKRIKDLLPVAGWQFHGLEPDRFAGVPYAKTLILIYRGSAAIGQRAKELTCNLDANEQTNKVEVYIRAESWQGNKLDYDHYVSAAKLIESVIGVYNGKHGAHLRMRIPTKDSLEPTLPPKARRLFDHMLVAARDQVIVNEGAWRSFYAFIKHTYSHRVLLSRDEFKRLLVLNNFDDDHAGELADFYFHGKELLAYPRYL